MFLTKPWDDELIRKNIADAFAFKEMLTENHRLSDEIRVSNRELAYVNRQLSDLLYQQEHQIRRDQVSINVIREILHQMPFAVIGTDSEEKIVFCNLAAEALFRDQMLPLDEYVGTAMPALLPLLHETMEGAIRELNLHQTLYRACWKAMGQHSTRAAKC
jgi:nitrogen fixation/metabolism regulation signal transduction histidine kinase